MLPALSTTTGLSNGSLLQSGNVDFAIVSMACITRDALPVSGLLSKA